MELRVLIHAPRGRDAAVVKDVIQVRHNSEICDTLPRLLEGLCPVSYTHLTLPTKA